MKNLFFIFTAMLFFKYVNAQNLHCIADNNIFLKYRLVSTNKDSFEVLGTLKNNSEGNIWIMENNLYNPGILARTLYLTVGLDMERHSPMDIVPFPLIMLKKGDSISFNSKLHADKYNSIIMTCNYLLNQDYYIILKEKESAFAIGELDYKKLMQSIYTYVELHKNE